MPGRSPYEAVEAFLDPLKSAMACVGTAHFSLSAKSTEVGLTHVWSLNGGEQCAIGSGYFLDAKMHFEIQDHGQSAGSGRFKVSTSGYMYAVLDDAHRELIAAHWHPTGRSPHVQPHWHLGSAALAPSGVFLERAPIPSPRVSFEYVVRWALEHLPGIEATRSDWSDVLAASEAIFDEHKSWGIA